MAPNIAPYAPYIQAIFREGIEYQIADMPLQTQHVAVEGLFFILDLEKNRWNAPVVLELLSHPLFRKKWGLSEEELVLIKTWVSKTGIRWGVNGEHRAHVLRRRTAEDVKAEEGATWLEGLGNLTLEL